MECIVRSNPPGTGNFGGSETKEFALVRSGSIFALCSGY
jgi:hypothetical protein